MPNFFSKSVSETTEEDRSGQGGPAYRKRFTAETHRDSDFSLPDSDDSNGTGLSVGHNSGSDDTCHHNIHDHPEADCHLSISSYAQSTIGEDGMYEEETTGTDHSAYYSGSEAILVGVGEQEDVSTFGGGGSHNMSMLTRDWPSISKMSLKSFDMHSAVSEVTHGHWGTSQTTSSKAT